MKVSLRPLLLATAALLAPQVSSASVLLAIDDITVSTNPITTGAPTGNYIAPGYSASLTGGGLVNSGGSDDGTFGTQVLPPAIAESNNGSAWVVNSNLQIATLSFTGNGLNTTLTGLLFDAATSTGRQNLEISYQVNNAGPTTITTFVALEADDFGAGTGNDFGDYILPLNLVLGGSDTIKFVFKSIGFGTTPGDSIYVDNIALVPEPGSLLALGCLMGGGAFFRSRRRRA